MIFDVILADLKASIVLGDTDEVIEYHKRDNQCDEHSLPIFCRHDCSEFKNLISMIKRFAIALIIFNI